MVNEGVLHRPRARRGLLVFPVDGSLVLTRSAIPVEKTERCLSSAVPALKTTESPRNADDLWSRLGESGNAVMNLGTRGSTAQT